MAKGIGGAKFRISDCDQLGVIIKLIWADIDMNVNLNASLENCSTLLSNQSVRPERSTELHSACVRHELHSA